MVFPGLNEPSLYPLIIPFLAAVFTYLANQSEVLISVNLFSAFSSLISLASKISFTASARFKVLFGLNDPSLYPLTMPVSLKYVIALA